VSGNQNLDRKQLNEANLKGIIDNQFGMPVSKRNSKHNQSVNEREDMIQL